MLHNKPLTKRAELLLWWKMRHLNWWDDIFMKEYYRLDLSPLSLTNENRGI